MGAIQLPVIKKKQPEVAVACFGVLGWSLRLFGRERAGRFRALGRRSSGARRLVCAAGRYRGPWEKKVFPVQQRKAVVSSIYVARRSFSEKCGKSSPEKVGGF